VAYFGSTSFEDTPKCLIPKETYTIFHAKNACFNELLAHSSCLEIGAVVKRIRTTISTLTKGERSMSTWYRETTNRRKLFEYYKVVVQKRLHELANLWLESGTHYPTVSVLMLILEARL